MKPGFLLSAVASGLLIGGALVVMASNMTAAPVAPATGTASR